MQDWPPALKVRFYDAVDTLCSNPEAGRHYKEDGFWSYEEKSAQPLIRVGYTLDRRRHQVKILFAGFSTHSFHKVHVFLSYSRKDREWLKALRRELQELEKFDIYVWCDDDIKPGQSWRSLIGKKVSDVNAALLLVSLDFLKSKFIRENELTEFLSRAEDTAEDTSKEPFLLLWVPLAQKRFIEADQLGDRLFEFEALVDPRKPLSRRERGESLASTLSRLSPEIHRAIYRGLRSLPV